MSDVDEIKKVLLSKPVVAGPTATKDYLSTGSVNLNLAMSGRSACGYAKGRYYLYVGDSGTAKTWLGLTSFAEAGINKHFSDYQFVFDNAENGAHMDLSRYFGRKTASRIIPPSGTIADPVYSTTVRSFYYHLDVRFKTGKPFIYLLDSMDALTTDAELDEFENNQKLHKSGKKSKGSYGTSKAKDNSANMRVVFNKLKETGSILIVLAQTRHNIGFGSQFNPKTRGGGDALTFYASHEIWTSLKERLKRKVNGKDRQIGTVIKTSVKKVRDTGKPRHAEIIHYPDVGIDDTGSQVRFLIQEGYWTGKFDGLVLAPEFSAKKIHTEDLVKMIEADGKYPELRSVTIKCWKEIEKKLQVERKSKYI